MPDPIVSVDPIIKGDMASKAESWANTLAQLRQVSRPADLTTLTNDDPPVTLLMAQVNDDGNAVIRLPLLTPDQARLLMQWLIDNFKGL